MIDSLLSLIAPHYCSGCGQTGTLLCDNCKYDIIHESSYTCIVCGKPQAVTQDTCRDCKTPYTRSWCVAERRDHLEKLINMYKFGNAKAAYKPLAQLLHERLPQLPPNVVIVPIPTVSGHIRERGYDHMRLIATQFARQRGVKVAPLLGRATTTKQRDASRATRIAQAKVAFVCSAKLRSDTTYLLLDDVTTTGSTLRYAAKKLRQAGAGEVWVAAICRQPLD